VLFSQHNTAGKKERTVTTTFYNRFYNVVAESVLNIDRGV